MAKEGASPKGDDELGAGPEAEDVAPARPPLVPIGTVRRELVRPDGKKIAVDVPVYPPFKLEDANAAAAKPKAKQPPRRVRPGAKPRPTGSD